MIILFLFTSANFLFLNLIEYFIHTLSHNPKIKFLYTPHHSHHLIYSPKNLTRKQYSDNANDSRLPYLIILISSYIFFYYILTIKYYIIFIIETTTYFYIANLLHNCYHLDNSFLEKYKWFKYLKKLHHIHHIEVYKNFNITIPISDKINNTYNYK